MSPHPHLRLVTALPRRIDAVLCAGSLANAARSVAADTRRADQRRDAAAAVRQLQSVPAPDEAPGRTSHAS